jgi:hypothetical protein
VSLLDQIIDEATDTRVPIATVLRRCKILASRLRYGPLAEWVERELGGYRNEDALPPYRETAVPVHVTVATPGAIIRRQPIGPRSLPEWVKEEDAEAVFRLGLPQGVAELEAMTQASTSTYLNPLPADLLPHLRTGIVDGVCVEGFREYSRERVVGVLDEVRNRVLGFCLELEQIAPEAGDIPAGAPAAVSHETLRQLLHVHIHGDHNVVAVGTGALAVSVGDWQGLVTALSALGVPADDIEVLREAIDRDRAAGAVDEDFGPAVQGWLGGLAGKVARGASAVAPEAAGGVIAGLLLRFFGIG